MNSRMLVLTGLVLAVLVSCQGEAPDLTSRNFAAFDMGAIEAATVLRSLAKAQAEELAAGLVLPEPATATSALVCLTKGADVWTVFDGGVRTEQDMRRLVWSRFEDTERLGNAFSEPMAFQPIDPLDYDFSAVQRDGQTYCWYTLDFGSDSGRHFRIWGDNWYLDVEGLASGQYRLAIRATPWGEFKASRVAELIEEVLES